MAMAEEIAHSIPSVQMAAPHFGGVREGDPSRHRHQGNASSPVIQKIQNASNNRSLLRLWKKEGNPSRGAPSFVPKGR